MDAKWRWLISYLLKPDFDDVSKVAHYDATPGKEEEVQELCAEWFKILHPRHRDALMEYYTQEKHRTPVLAQNLYHGRMALWAVLHCRSNSLKVYNLGRLCHERTIEN